MQVANIPTKNWQMSLSEPEAVVLGFEDVQQCIAVILSTRKGEDPLRPFFGCDIWQYIDKPIQSAIPNMKKNILEALKKHEKRIKVKKIQHEIKKENNVLFHISYTTDNVEEIQHFSFSILSLLGQNGAHRLILSAGYINNGNRYRILLKLGNNAPLYSVPKIGFSTIQQLHDWAKSNWYIFGDFFNLQNQNKILMYVKNGIATSGTLHIDSIKVVSATFPPIDFTKYYRVVIRKNGQLMHPRAENDLTTKSKVLNFVQTFYSSCGEWSVDGNELNLIVSNNENYTINIYADGIVRTNPFSRAFNNSFG